MLFVRKTFKSNGKCFTAGSVVTEPAAMKHFKRRLFDRYLIEVTEQNFDKWYNYFLVKHGVEITIEETEEEIEEIQKPSKEPLKAQVVQPKIKK